MITSLFWRMAIVISALSIIGCSQTAKQTDDSTPQAWLEPGVRITLPAPGITPEISSQQLLTGSVNGQTQSLLVLLNADANRITLAGLSSVGIRLFLVTYDANGIQTEQSMVVPQLPPASQVLADVMLSYWPIVAWQHQLPKGWSLKDQGDKRELRNARGKLITEITYLQRNNLLQHNSRREPISIRQHAFNYHISIQYLGN